MKVAFLFAGQGAEFAGMGRGLDAGVAAALAPLLNGALDATGVNVGRALEADAPGLLATEVLQPTLVALGLAAHARLVAAGVAPAAVAGHSLGELTAVAAAGGIAPERAVAIAARRGRLMADAARASPGGMIAVAHEVAIDGLDLAAENASDEWVYAGPEDTVRRALVEVRATRLAVGGPWHSEAMSGARDALRRALADEPWTRPTTPLVSNRDGSWLASDARLPDVVAEQLTRPVRWRTCLTTLTEAGIDTFVTLGPGKPVRGLVRRVLGPRARILGTEDARDVARTLEALT